MGDEPEDPGKDRLLPGESTSISSGDIADMREWVAIYHELYSFKELLLEEVEQQKRRVQKPGAAELENDRKLLEREAERIRRRLIYWQKRLAEKGAS